VDVEVPDDGDDDDEELLDVVFELLPQATSRSPASSMNRVRALTAAPSVAPSRGTCCDRRLLDRFGERAADVVVGDEADHGAVGAHDRHPAGAPGRHRVARVAEVGVIVQLHDLVRHHVSDGRVAGSLPRHRSHDEVSVRDDADDVV
jgi:hypothetical protein